MNALGWANAVILAVLAAAWVYVGLLKDRAVATAN